MINMNPDNAKFLSLLSDEQRTIVDEINDLKNKNNVIILAHTYQPEPIQLIADVLGDSLKLAKSAQQEKDAKYILFAGVKFMAETASILNPDKVILFPERESICSMAEYASRDALAEYKQKNPNIPIVVYINSTAETKTMADVVCTSANSINIVKAIQKEYNSEKVGFSPDKNLGGYISKKTGIPIDVIPKDGNCYVHNNYTVEDVKSAKEKHPNAKLLTHPESPFDVLELSDFIGSTSQIIKFAEEHPDIDEFIIGTEIGVVDYLKRVFPNKKIVPLCESAVCSAMKAHSLKSILRTLKNLDSEKYIVKVDEKTAAASIKAIEKMMELS